MFGGFPDPVAGKTSSSGGASVLELPVACWLTLTARPPWNAMPKQYLHGQLRSVQVPALTWATSTAAPVTQASCVPSEDQARVLAEIPSYPNVPRTCGVPVPQRTRTPPASAVVGPETASH